MACSAAGETVPEDDACFWISVQAGMTFCQHCQRCHPLRREFVRADFKNRSAGRLGRGKSQRPQFRFIIEEFGRALAQRQEQMAAARFIDNFPLTQSPSANPVSAAAIGPDGASVSYIRRYSILFTTNYWLRLSVLFLSRL